MPTPLRWLDTFTFRDQGERDELRRAAEAAPERREAQRVLAADLTRLVHGDEQHARAVAVTDALFGTLSLAEIPVADLVAALEGAPTMAVDPAAAIPTYTDLLVGTGLASSRGAARRLVEGGGVSVNDARISSADDPVDPSDFLDGRLLVLRRGRRERAVVLRGG